MLTKFHGKKPRNFCKHIHLLCRFLKEKESAESSNIYEAEHDFEDLAMDVDSFAERRSREVAAHVKDLTSEQPFSIERLQFKFSSLCALVNDQESFNIVLNCLNRADGLLQTMGKQLPIPSVTVKASREPSNKRIEQQPCFVS